jgi:lipopolysaccharide export system permease protein
MRRFILSRYILREHFGPFGFSFATITLIFLLDLVFRHLSRILSKGLPPAVVIEFLGLNLAWIVATAAPMAVLTATLMAFGRLAADHEITAMQASGISLARQTTPIFLAAFALAAGLIWFNNNVLPDWKYRARALAMDIARKSPASKSSRNLVL